MYRIHSVTIVLLLVMAGCQSTSQPASVGHKAPNPVLLEDNPYTGDNVLDIVERLEDPEKRKEFIASLDWREGCKAWMNAWTMTALSIVDRRGHINEVPPKLRAEYYLSLIKPLRNIEGWKSWERGHCHADWWIPYLKQESEKLVFHDFGNGCNDRAIQGLWEMGAEAAEFIIDYIGRQEAEAARTAALFCLEASTDGSFDLFRFLDGSDWHMAAAELRKWWEKANNWSKSEIARDSLSDSNLLVRVHGAKLLITCGEKEGIGKLLATLKEMVADYDKYADEEYGSWKERTYRGISKTLIENLGGNGKMRECSNRKNCEEMLKQCEKLYQENYDKLTFEEKEKEFRLPAGK